MAQYNLGQNRLADWPTLSLTLLLDIPDLPQFDSATPAAWTLLDGANAILRTGVGPLDTLPRAERVIALAPVGRLLWIETALPPVAPAKRNALLRYAIEDKLTIDPSTVHAVILGNSGNSGNSGHSGKADHVVAAIDRTWLVGVLQWLTRGGLPADNLISGATGIAVAAGEWAVVLDHTHGYAKRADGFVYNLDIGRDREPPFGLTLALKEARQHQRAPTALVLHAAPSRDPSPPLDAALCRRWENLLDVPVRLAAPSTTLLQALVAAGKSANLLTGEFAPREALGKWLEILRPALIAAALIVVLHLAFTLIDNARLNAERGALEAQMTGLFKTAFPNAQAIVDPPLQMERNLAQMKLERGIATQADAQMQLARLTNLLQALPGAPPSIQSLTLQGGVATLDAVLNDAAQRAALTRALEKESGAALGSSTSADAASATQSVRITLRAGG